MNRVLKLKKIYNICKNTLGLLFIKPGGLRFHPGQFVKLTIINPHFPDLKKNSRLFSVASAPSLKNYMLFAVRITQSGFTKNLMSLKPGDNLLCSDPEGNFMYDDNVKTSVFIAGGMGITPFRSIIEELALHGKNKNIVLLYANKDRDSVAFNDDLSKWKKENVIKGFHLFVDELKGTSDEFLHGFITIDKILHIIKDVRKKKFYIVGPPPMLENLWQGLININVSKENIVMEKF